MTTPLTDPMLTFTRKIHELNPQHYLLKLLLHLPRDIELFHHVLQMLMRSIKAAEMTLNQHCYCSEVVICVMIKSAPNSTSCVCQCSLYPRPTKLEGGYTGFTLSVRLSVCPSVRPSVWRHGFRNISQVCFGISISNFICMLMLAIGRSLLIFSEVTFKMASWRPYWSFWFLDSNFTLALKINFKLQRHNTYVYG